MKKVDEFQIKSAYCYKILGYLLHFSLFGKGQYLVKYSSHVCSLLLGNFLLVITLRNKEIFHLLGDQCLTEIQKPSHFQKFELELIPVILVTPPKVVATPTIAYKPGVIH